MSRPADLQYTKSHEWVRVEGDVAVIGITDYAVEQLGDLAFVDLPEEGTTLAVGDSFGEIESTKTVATLYSPVAGEIVAVNGDLEDNLQRISDSPFDDPHFEEGAYALHVTINALDPPTPAPTPTPTATAMPTPTAVPTASPTASPTALPTTVPTASPTAVPTVTPSATPGPSTTPTPTPTPTPELGVMLQLFSGAVGLAWLQRRRGRRVRARSKS